MFRKWLSENKVETFDYSGTIIEKASNREFWEPRYKKEYIEKAEKYLGFQWPLIRATDYIAFKKEGNRVKQETPHFERRSALISLLIGEILEYKGRFIPDIIDGVYSICEEFYWGLSAHYDHSACIRLPFGEHFIDLFAAETGSLISVIQYMLHDELSEYFPESVERMQYNLQERIVKPYLKYSDFGWMGNTGRVNNWNPWIISNILTVFLLTQQKKDTFFSGIHKMIYEINAIYKEYPDDGGCDEGVSYWSVSGGTIFEFCEQLYRATNGKINFFTDQKIKNIGDFPYKAYIGNGYFVNFADGNSKISSVWQSKLYGYGKRINNESLSLLSCQMSKDKTENLSSNRVEYTKSVLFNLIYDKELSQTGNFKLCESAFLPDLQNAFAREDKWYYAAKGGHNAENHNHNDVGSFIAYYDCEPVLVDPGCGVYTKQTFSPHRYEIWTMRSEWHNTPIINGKQQIYGKEHKADSFQFNNKISEISFAKAYEEGMGLEKLTREISVTDSGINLCDNFEFETGNNVIAEHFITPFKVEIKKNAAIINGKFILSANCDMEVFTEKQEFFGDEKLTEAWKTDCMNRIVFKTTAQEKTNIKFNLRSL